MHRNDPRMRGARRGYRTPVLSYVLPLRAASPRPDLTGYLASLPDWVEVIVVDGSPPAVFDQHARWWGDAVRHVPVEKARRTPMGKVGGVMTGVACARHPMVVVADDDVRHDASTLEALMARLTTAEVVRPQNYFRPCPWHAWWDTGRTLLARALDGDWPGTLALRRDALLAAGGYRGDVMFENLELVRTLRAAGGREVVALDLFVPREPPTTRHFLGQRVRQAYDELGRPARLVASLALLPAWVAGGRRTRVALVVATLLLAERGRRRAGGTDVFPAHTVLAAPLWAAERAVTSWLALLTRVLRGGVGYGGGRLRDAASSPAQLRARLGAARRSGDRATFA